MRAVIASRIAMLNNPGRAAYGLSIHNTRTGEESVTNRVIMGELTSNRAEYQGLMAALAVAADQFPQETVEIVLVSEVVIDQMLGQRSANDPRLHELRDDARDKILQRVVLTKGTDEETQKARQAAWDALSVDKVEARREDRAVTSHTGT